MTRRLNPLTGQMDEVDDLVAGFYDEMWARLEGAAAAARAIGAAPASPAPKPSRVPSRLIVPWTDAQLDSIRDGLPGRYRLFVDVGAALGTREGESFGLNLEDFDDPMRNYGIRQQVKRVPGGRAFAPPKAGRERSVPVPPRLRELIREHIAAYGTTTVTLPWLPSGKPRTRTLLLTSTTGTSLNAAYFGRLFGGALDHAGLEPSRENKTHMLRHLAASRWIAEGADVLMVSDLLGHADLATTQAYIKRLKTHDTRTRRVVAKAAPKPPRRKAPADPDVIDFFTARQARRGLS